MNTHEPKAHLIIHYVLLLSIFLAGGLSLILVDNKTINTVVLVALSVIYITWGVWHHHEHSTLTKNTFLEYLSVSGIIIVVYLLAA